MLKTFFVLFSFCVVYCVGNDAVPLRCGANQEVRCVPTCPPERTCRNRGIQFSCLQTCERCQHKCVCKEGFYRNFLGDCITNEQCDLCPGNNEFYACDSACDNECSTWHKQNRTNCPIINIDCNRGCYCDDGYARDSKRNCVPVEKCPATPICKGPNEEYTSCRRTCPPETCISVISRYDCRTAPPCRPGCACKPGFLRQSANSHCIPACECLELRNTPACRSGLY
ncbi:inducible metalloproteinase inhibitor protein-like isoform X1 [Anticarsia gemmatalis]|uniref:inducible metalloproteinase inhibitor protein-like isoform X1 n=1 Tax=Anticarsia gemmatalis TaxID=129554 RepID=UPI003F76A48E